MIRVIAWCSVAAAMLLPSCAYMQLDREDLAVDYAYAAPFRAPPFETAAIVVNGEAFTATRNVPGLALGDEKAHYRALVDAFREKAVFARLAEPGEKPALEIACDFRIEDDVNALHRSVSMLTLYVFPFWKMVRVSVIAEVRSTDVRFDPFWFEDEVQVYVSPILFAGVFFAGRPNPEQRLAQEAGRALAMHVIRTVRRLRTADACPEVEAPADGDGSAAPDPDAETDAANATETGAAKAAEGGER